MGGHKYLFLVKSCLELLLAIGNIAILAATPPDPLLVRAALNVEEHCHSYSAQRSFRSCLFAL